MSQKLDVKKYYKSNGNGEAELDFTQQKVSKGDTAKIASQANIISSFTNVNSVNLGDYDYSNLADFQKIFDALKTLPIHTLRLSNTTFGNQHIKLLSDAVKQGYLPNLHTLLFDGSNLTGDCMSDLVDILNTVKISSISICTTDIFQKEGAFKEFMKADMRHLKSLEFNETGIDNTKFQFLVQKIHRGEMTELQQIEMMHNQITARSIISLTHALKSDKAPKLHTLELTSNEIGDVGVETIMSNLLSSYPCLKILYVGDNDMTEKGAESVLSKVTEHPNHFEDLHIVASIEVDIATNNESESNKQDTLTRKKIIQEKIYKIVDATFQNAHPEALEDSSDNTASENEEFEDEQSESINTGAAGNHNHSLINSSATHPTFGNFAHYTHHILGQQNLSRGKIDMILKLAASNPAFNAHLHQQVSHCAARLAEAKGDASKAFSTTSILQAEENSSEEEIFGFGRRKDADNELTDLYEFNSMSGWGDDTTCPEKEVSDLDLDLDLDHSNSSTNAKKSRQEDAEFNIERDVVNGNTYDNPQNYVESTGVVLDDSSSNNG